MAMMINFTDEDINYIEKKINREIKNEKDLKETLIDNTTFLTNIIKLSKK